MAWEHAGQRYFDGEVEPCVNGRTIETGAYFGVDVAPIVEQVLGERLEDGGWNCEAEDRVTVLLGATIDVLDTVELECASGGSPGLSAARRSGEEYLLERRLFRRKSTGEVVKPAYLGRRVPLLLALRRAAPSTTSDGQVPRPNPRMAEAVEMVRSKQQPDGRWLLNRVYPGRVHFELRSSIGSPSRWNTLRALRVLRWSGSSARVTGAGDRLAERRGTLGIDSLP